MSLKLLILCLFFISTNLATTISGHIRDSRTNKLIPNANITIKESGAGMASNANGYFEINSEIGQYTLETSVIGFEIDRRRID